MMVDKPGLTDVKIENGPKKKIFGDWIHKGALVLYKGDVCMIVAQPIVGHKFCRLMLNGFIQNVRKAHLRPIPED